MARKYSITDDIYNYAKEISLKEPAITVELRDESFETERAARMLSTPEQMQFISLLLKLINPKKCLEIGVYTGYSTLWTALATGNECKIIGLEIKDRYKHLCEKYWQKAGVAHKIDLRIAPALGTINTMIENGEAGTFDYIYIDADKSNYPEYFEKSYTLLRTGGLMIFDNIFLFGRVLENDPENHPIPHAIAEFNKQLFKENRVDISTLPIGDGMTLAYKL